MKVESQDKYYQRPSYSRKKMQDFDMHSYIPLYPLSGGFAYSNFSYFIFFEIYIELINNKPIKDNHYHDYTQ